MLEYSRTLKPPSRKLRSNMTDAEQVLWSRLRGKQLLGVQFYRQKPIGSFIVDFYCHAAALVIEVDGGQHYEAEHARRDVERDKYLADAGLLVMRFNNLQALQETDAVVEEIMKVIEQRQIPPGPPLQSGVTANPSQPPFTKGGACEVPLHKGGFRGICRSDLGGFAFDPIPISALEHYAYCPRQCALIHVEQVWDENLYTMRGRDVHEHVHDDSSHQVAGVRLERSLPIWNRRLNLNGKADLVEFHDNNPYPVEYKSGKRRKGNPEVIQLCAQALCLEEMFNVSVPKGALFWHGSRERVEIVFTPDMRTKVESLVAAVREMIEKRIVPPPVNDKRCDGCSLKESCLPSVVADKARNRKAARELFEI
jgi:CRISPR-associated exonuclease Cas4